MSDSLVLTGVCKDYGDFALRDVSFAVPGGCIMGLIGENGAGKTTTLRLILNQIRRDGGEISILGLDNIRGEQRIKEQIGVVFDECSFHPVLTPGEIGAVLAPLYKTWDAALYDRRLREWGIPRGKAVGDLSKGMKMKLSIAACLAHHPRLLLLDEATGGLDPIMRGEMLDIFREFIEDDAHAILFSTHITSDLEHIADYITFLHEGRVLLTEDKDALLERCGIVRCSREQESRIPRELVMGARRTDFGTEALVRDAAKVRRLCPGLLVDRAVLEDIMMLMIKGEQL